MPERNTKSHRNQACAQPAGTGHQSHRSILEAASAYIDRGWCVVPVPPGKKGPRLRGWQRLRINRDEVGKYFKRDCNIGVLLGEPSLGLVDVDLDSPTARALALDFLPSTGMIHGRRGSPASHWWYLVPEHVPSPLKSCDQDGTCLVEIRSTGQQTLLPPSVHPSEERLVWEKEDAPLQIDGVSLKEAVSRLAAASLLVLHWPPRGSRHEVALSLAGLLLRHGWNADEVANFISVIARAAGDEEWNNRAVDVRSTARRLQQDGSATGGKRLEELLGKSVTSRIFQWLELGESIEELVRDGHCTDLGNARRLAKRHGDDLRDCRLWRQWLVWDGTRWVTDDTGEVERRAKQTVESIYQEAASARTKQEREALARWAKRSESAPRIRAMIALAETEPGIWVRPSQLDTNPWLLNCANGTLDLRSGDLYSHRREDLITKQVAIPYDPDATCPHWMDFLTEIMDANLHLVEYLQHAVGYALTGVTLEQVLFLLYGIGANGKSTFLETLRRVFGEYARQADFTSFLTRKNDTIRNDLARLAGARLVSAIEVEEGRKLSEALVKQATGGDTITARFLFKEFFEFGPEFKLFLAVNHKPVIRGTDYAIWRRIRLIPFAVMIPPERQDKDLLEKLLTERTGILAWAVRGCLAWQKRGLEAPEDVLNATQAYREEMDVLGDFLSERCVQSKTAWATAKDLYDAYVNWCETTGEEPLSQRMFGLRLTERGFLRYRRGGKRCWKGVAPVTQVTEGAPLPRDDGDASTTPEFFS